MRSQTDDCITAYDEALDSMGPVLTAAEKEIPRSSWLKRNDPTAYRIGLDEYRTEVWDTRY